MAISVSLSLSLSFMLSPSPFLTLSLSAMHACCSHLFPIPPQPERIDQEDAVYDQRSDVWSYGITVVSTLRTESYKHRIVAPNTWPLESRLDSQLTQCVLQPTYFVPQVHLEIYIYLFQPETVVSSPIQ